MGFWDLFTTPEQKTFSSRIHEKLSQLFPDDGEQELTKWACISGLLARVAHRDMKITKEEEDHIVMALQKWNSLDKSKAESIKDIAITDVVDLAGLENHCYCAPLNEILSKEERYNLLETLFALAASDGVADNSESEEIRLISKGLLLEPKDFVAARASVLEFLGAAKNN